MFYGKKAGKNLFFMKQILTVVILLTLLNKVSAQELSKAIPTYIIKTAVINFKVFESPAYINEALFTSYLNWSLVPDSMPTAIRPAEKFSIEMLYVISKEGKLIEARAGTNEKNELINYIIQKLVTCPYQWSPAYRNGRPVKSYQRIKIVFGKVLDLINDK